MQAASVAAQGQATTSADDGQAQSDKKARAHIRVMRASILDTPRAQAYDTHPLVQFSTTQDTR